MILRPLEPGDAAELLRILETPEVARWWDEPDAGYPLTDGVVAGMITKAVRMVVRHLVGERGHHRITNDPAAANATAIRAYEKAGFSRVGVMRRYERDTGGGGWHDGLLMEYVGVV